MFLLAISIMEHIVMCSLFVLWNQVELYMLILYLNYIINKHVTIMVTGRQKKKTFQNGDWRVYDVSI